MGQPSSLESTDRVIEADTASLDDCLEQIVGGHPTGVVLTNPAGRIRFANRAALSLFEYADGELVGQPFEVLLPPSLHAEHARHRLRRQRSTAPSARRPRHWQGRTRDGRAFAMVVRLLPFRTSGQSGIAYVVEPSETAAELVLHQNSLRQIIENTTAVVYVKDLEGRYLLVNAQFEALFHLDREAIRGLTDFDLFPAAMAEAFRENDAHVARTGQTLKVDEIAPHDDGPHTYISVKFPLRDDRENIVAVAGISTDITDRVRAELAEEELRDRLELILNSINNGIVGLDKQGVVTFANPTALQLLKADTASLGALMPSVAMDVATRANTIPTEGLRPTGRETKLRRSDGTSFHAEFQVYPVVEHGRHQGAVVAFQDVTDRKRREAIERQLQSARAVQQILYPHQWPICPRFDIAGHVYSADTMCGDYLDFIPTSDSQITIAVGDVSGHGFGPALQMVETRACLRSMLMSGHSLSESVSVLNNLLIADLPTESFISLFAAQIDAASLTLSCVTAGHAAWLFREGHPPRKITGEGLVLGIDPEQSYDASPPQQLQPGDTLLLPTDGVQETQNTSGELFGIGRMLQSVAGLRHRTAVEVVDGLYFATTEFAGLRRQGDDVTIAVVNVL